MLKLIVSGPGLAFAALIASRNDRLPSGPAESIGVASSSSKVVLTVKVEGTARHSSCSSRGFQLARLCRRDRRVGFAEADREGDFKEPRQRVCTMTQAPCQCFSN